MKLFRDNEAVKLRIDANSKARMEIQVRVCLYVCHITYINDIYHIN